MRPLHAGWTLSAADHPPVPASVPGCVHTDLLAAGLIDDPYLDDNEQRLAWIGRQEWRYDTTFTWTDDGHDRVDLVCEGLDTVATVLVNGVRVGETANMHRSYRFEVRELLREGDNALTVVFASPYYYAEAQKAALGLRPGAYVEPYNFIRKMACNFGWDWGPTLVTSGIWRPIGLDAWSGARLAEVRPLVSSNGRVDVCVRVERASQLPVLVTAEVAGISGAVRLAPGACEGVITLDVPSPELWWPRGYGEQPLYELTVRAGASTWSKRIGFRSVELERDAFALVINGRKVFAKGFNWIPDDCFPARITRDDLAERFGQAIDAGANLLRVWGGGLYESADFYELADELGLLVWQDFPFACAAYPEEEPFASEVEAEARENVARLMSHPSLVLWCGNNENIEGERHWGWRDELQDRSWGAGFYFDLLPRIVAELDPSRPYWPGSPYSGSPDADPLDPARGTIHIWTVWNTHDYTFYDTYSPRFVAEFGFQGPPAYATLRRASSDEPLTPDSSHQKAVDGQAKLINGLAGHLPSPDTFDDWHYRTQLNQARAMAYGIERFRALGPYCMGTIVWQLNDCWPVTSWAAVDGDGRKKPLWYGLRRAYAPRLLTFQGDELAAVNDTDEVWSGEVAVVAMTSTGEVLAKDSLGLSVPPRGVTRLPLPSEGELLSVSAYGAAPALRVQDESTLPRASYDTVVERVNDGVLLHVTAHTVVRELAVFPDRLDPAARVDDQLVTLLPGQSVTFHISTRADLDPGLLTSHPVLRCVNE
ncbi:glycoside hydrolase family 2 protein [Nonomuraea sp. NPDC050556]|uniref:glycoside hydrolase family 2 protein n=1 Tax=Nonomuraea sp. NPDC050556 TaxID=3364369 RepID=UPI0037AB0459